MAWDPPLAARTPRCCAAFNRHQRRDKGLGPALGPDAARGARAALGRRGYAARLGAEPVAARAAQAALQAALVEGIAAGGRGGGLRGGGGLGSGAARGERRRPLHGRPCRRAGAAGRGERAVEDDVGVEPVDVRLRPQRVGEPGDRRGAQARGPGADDQRRDRDVQPLQQARVEEARRSSPRRPRRAPGFEPALGERGRGSPPERSSRRAPAARTTSTPGGRVRSQAWTTRRRAPSAASTCASSGSRPRGSITTRAGLGPSTRRTVSRGSSASAVRTPTTTASASARQRCRWRRPSGPEIAGRVAGDRRDAAVERLADLREEIGRLAARRRQRRVERPGGAGLGRPVGVAARRAAPRAARAAPPRPRPSSRRAASADLPISPAPARRGGGVRLIMTLAPTGARKGRGLAARGLEAGVAAEGGEEAVAERRHRPGRRLRRRDHALAPAPAVEPRKRGGRADDVDRHVAARRRRRRRPPAGGRRA